MTTQYQYIILLRGVMPSGKNRVPMAQLREVLKNAGFSNVRTYIQTGNVLLTTRLSLRETEQRIHDLILENIGADIAVVGRITADLEKVLEENPFGEGYDIKRVFFALLAELPDPQKTADLLQQDFSPEELVISGKTAYMYIPGNYTKAKINNNFLERKLKITATSRNFNTLSKMITLSKEEYE